MTDLIDSRYGAARVFDEQAEAYDAWFVDSPEYAIELAALTTLQQACAAPALEVGVGTGRFAEKLGVAFGVDPAWAPLKLATERGVRCCQAMGEQLPIRSGTIGTAYLLFTLCFVADPEQTLLECSRVLRYGGTLVVGMIPAGSAWGGMLAAKKRAGHPIYRYARLYTIEKVKSWLGRLNMNIVECRSTLYQSPDCVERFEFPGDVLDERAGFAVIAAVKDHG